MAQARACCVSKMFLLFLDKLLLSVVCVLLLLCLGQGAEEAPPSHPCMALNRNIPGALKYNELRKDMDFFSCL